MITAAVVTFHTSRKDLIRLIDCVLHSSIDKFFIIDNSTNDALREFESTSERITYIYSDNLGFGSGHNVAINRAMDLGCDYHIIINPDIYWDENVIEKLTQFMNENRDCGLVMPKILYPNGEVQYLCKLLPTPLDLFGRRFSIYVNCFLLRWIYLDEDSFHSRLFKKSVMHGMKCTGADMRR